MKKEVLLLKYGELILKKLNKQKFEKKLIENIKNKIKRHGNFSVKNFQSIIYVEALDDCSSLRLASGSIKKVFGISKICAAYFCEKDIDEIKTLAGEVLERSFEQKNIKTFKVKTVREDKNFFLNSMEINAQIGGFILSKFSNLKVDLAKPQIILNIEIRNKCYLHVRQEKGLGGLPNGTNGKSLVLLSGGIDSPVSAFMIGKRGVEIEAIHFFSYPYTSEKAKEKVIELSQKLSEYLGKIKLYVVSFTDIQVSLIENSDKKYLTILMRRCMMKIAQKIAVKNGSSALITGESIGQVASQTMQSLFVIDNAVSIPVFRPLIGMDKEEIIAVSKKADFFETSILPHEDCCTIFVPKHPIINPSLDNVLDIETKLKINFNLEGLINEAIEIAEIIICENV